MVKATDTRQSDHLCVRRWSRLNGALLRRISNHSVNTLRVVVGDIVAEQSAQMVLIEYNHGIEGFEPA